MAGLRARAFVLIVAVGLMAAVAVGIGEAAAITSAGTAGGHVLVWAADFMAGAVTVSWERAVAQAEAFDVIAVLRGTYHEYVADMRAANPDLVLLVYLNGALAQSTQGETYPDDWYARDAAGNKVRSVGWGNYLMRPDDPGWIADVASRCRTFLAYSGYDGCFLDVLGTAPLNPGYVTGLPIDPSTGRVWEKQAWLRATANIAEQTRLAVAPAPVFGNGLANGSSYFSPDAPSATILEGLDGAMAETFVRDPRGPIASYRSESRWKSNVDMLADAGDRGGAWSWP